MGNLPRNLPAVAKAKLPDTYNAAKTALAECSKIDECKDWADKAAAMASYAKQAEDKSLEHMSMRIRSRAIQRCGELLEAIKPGKTGPKNSGSAAAPNSRSKAASDAGMSKRQMKTAIRVARVPKNEFDELVESDEPPTITQLAERGKRVDVLQGRKPHEFQLSMGAEGRVGDLVKFSRKADPAAVVRGFKIEKQKGELIELSREAIEWLRSLIEELKK